MLLVDLPNRARAADAPAGGAAADPFASPAESHEPTSTEDEEAAVLGAPNRPKPTPQPPPPAPARAAAAPRRSAGDRRATQAGDEEQLSASAEKPADLSGVAVELSTSGFASGALAGGLFIGGRIASGVIIGGFLDFSLTSVTTTQPTGPETTTSMEGVRLGAGVRLPFVQSADHRVELYGAGDVSFDHRSAELPSPSGTTPTQVVTASGFSLAAAV